MRELNNIKQIINNEIYCEMLMFHYEIKCIFIYLIIYCSEIKGRKSLVKFIQNVKFVFISRIYFLNLISIN